MNSIKLKKTLKLILFLTSVSSIILIILFILLSLIILFSNFSPTLANKLTTIFGGIGMFTATYIAARILNKKGILVGLTCGGTLGAIIFMISFLSTGILFSITEFIKIITILLASCFGGIIGANSKQ